MGPYTLYWLAKNGLAPVGILNQESETIVAIGAIMAGIPMVDQIPIAEIRSGQNVRIDGELVEVDG